jgi:uncharacterized Fe-S cluster-containing radical SAM superfamily protein
MRKYERIKDYNDGKFRRITGVQRETFDEMVKTLKIARIESHSRRGRKPKLCTEDMLLATLEYFREKRTFAYIAASYGLHESNAYRTIRKVEKVLIEDGAFTLPGHKHLSKDNSEDASDPT